MTQEEITTIVEQVLQSLLTSGRTIPQLTAVTDVGESDCFELSGGRKVSFGTLAGLIVNKIGTIENITVVDYDGRDEITSFSYTASSGTIKIKQSGRSSAKSITISTATTSRPGLMSAADKASLNNVVNKIVSALGASTSASNAVLSVTLSDGTTRSATLAAASTTKAGLMSAADKVKLDRAQQGVDMLINKQGAENGIATLDSNGKLNGSQLPDYVIKDTDIASKANLNGARKLNAEEWPTLMLYNVTSVDVSGAAPGDVILMRRSQGSVNIAMLYYVSESNEYISIGVPCASVMYCHKSTGKLYRWDDDGGEFVRIGDDPDEDLPKLQVRQDYFERMVKDAFLKSTYSEAKSAVAAIDTSVYKVTTDFTGCHATSEIPKYVCKTDYLYFRIAVDNESQQIGGIHVTVGGVDVSARCSFDYVSSAGEYQVEIEIDFDGDVVITAAAS